MQQNKQKGSVLFIFIVIIGLILVTQYNLKSIFESPQFKENMTYLRSIPTMVFKTLVIDPTVNNLKTQVENVGLNQTNIDKLNKGEIPEEFKQNFNISKTSN
ncbi:MAG: hypothetical protein RL687_159 [Candidatus Parcubacteria bacterium]|jgi:hypothetical protein